MNILRLLHGLTHIKSNLFVIHQKLYSPYKTKKSSSEEWPSKNNGNLKFNLTVKDKKIGWKYKGYNPYINITNIPTSFSKMRSSIRSLIKVDLGNPNSNNL